MAAGQWAATLPLYHPAERDTTTSLTHMLLSARSCAGWGSAIVSPHTYTFIWAVKSCSPTSNLPWQAAWAQSEARLTTHPTCPRCEQCPPPSQHYLFHILIAVKAEAGDRLTETECQGSSPWQVMPSEHCVCPQCIAPCFAKQQLVCLTGSLKAFKQVSEVAESEFALEPSSGVLLHGNPHPAFTSGHLLPYCAQQRQTDTYPKGPLYNKGNCNFIKKMILPKVVRRMIVGGSGRHLHSLESHLPTHPQ